MKGTGALPLYATGERGSHPAVSVRVFGGDAPL